MIKTEHNEHCREIANLINAIADGLVWRCGECGEWFNEEEDAVEIDACEFVKCPSCGEMTEWEDLCYSNCEQVTMFDYFDDVYDIKYTFDGNRELVGGRLMIACGGPNIYVDTFAGEVQLHWWSESGSWDISSDACYCINEMLIEMWGC